MLDPRTGLIVAVAKDSSMNTEGNTASLDSVANDLMRGGDGTKPVKKGGSRRLWSAQGPPILRSRLLPGLVSKPSQANASANHMSLSFLAYAPIPADSLASAEDDPSRLSAAKALKEKISDLDDAGFRDVLAPALEALAEAQDLPPGSVVAVAAPDTAPEAVFVTRTELDWSLLGWYRWAVKLPVEIIAGGCVAGFIFICVVALLIRRARARRGARIVSPDDVVVFDDIHKGFEARQKEEERRRMLALSRSRRRLPAPDESYDSAEDMYSVRTEDSTEFSQDEGDAWNYDRHRKKGRPARRSHLKKRAPSSSDDESDDLERDDMKRERASRAARDQGDAELRAREEDDAMRTIVHVRNQDDEFSEGNASDRVDAFVSAQQTKQRAVSQVIKARSAVAALAAAARKKRAVHPIKGGEALKPKGLPPLGPSGGSRLIKAAGAKSLEGIYGIHRGLNIKH